MADNRKLFPDDIINDLKEFGNNVELSADNLRNLTDGLGNLNSNLKNFDRNIGDRDRKLNENLSGMANATRRVSNDLGRSSEYISKAQTNFYRTAMPDIMDMVQGQIMPQMQRGYTGPTARMQDRTVIGGSAGRALGEDFNKNLLQLSHTLSPASFMQYATMYGVTFPAQMEMAEVITRPVKDVAAQFKSVEKFAMGFTGIGSAIEGFSRQMSQTPMQMYEGMYQSQIMLASALGGEKASNKAVESALQMAREYPVRTEEVLSSLSRLAVYPEVKPYIGQEKFQRQLMETVSGLSLIVPEQGMEGAMFSLVEAMSGSWRSLQMRFNVSPEIIEQLSGMTKEEMSSDPQKLIQGLHSFIGQAVGLDVLEKQKYTFSKQVDNFGDSLQLLTRNVFETTGLYGSVVGGATLFQTGFASLAGNQEFLNMIGGIFSPFQERLDKAVADFAGVSVDVYKQAPMSQIVSIMEDNFKNLSMEDIGERFRGLVDNVSGIWRDTNMTISDIIYDQFGTTLGDIGGDISTVIADQFSKITYGVMKGMQNTAVENPMDLVGPLMTMGTPLIGALIGGQFLTSFFQKSLEAKPLSQRVFGLMQKSAGYTERGFERGVNEVTGAIGRGGPDALKRMSSGEVQRYTSNYFNEVSTNLGKNVDDIYESFGKNVDTMFKGFSKAGPSLNVENFMEKALGANIFSEMGARAYFATESAKKGSMVSELRKAGFSREQIIGMERARAMEVAEREMNLNQRMFGEEKRGLRTGNVEALKESMMGNVWAANVGDDYSRLIGEVLGENLGQIEPGKGIAGLKMKVGNLNILRENILKEFGSSFDEIFSEGFKIKPETMERLKGTLGGASKEQKAMFETITGKPLMQTAGISGLRTVRDIEKSDIQKFIQEVAKVNRGVEKVESAVKSGNMEQIRQAGKGFYEKALGAGTIDELIKSRKGAEVLQGISGIDVGKTVGPFVSDFLSGVVDVGKASRLGPQVFKGGPLAGQTFDIVEDILNNPQLRSMQTKGLGGFMADLLATGDVDQIVSSMKQLEKGSLAVKEVIASPELFKAAGGGTIARGGLRAISALQESAIGQSVRKYGMAGAFGKALPAIGAGLDVGFLGLDVAEVAKLYGASTEAAIGMGALTGGAGLGLAAKAGRGSILQGMGRLGASGLFMGATGVAAFALDLVKGYKEGTNLIEKNTKDYAKSVGELTGVSPELKEKMKMAGNYIENSGDRFQAGMDNMLENQGMPAAMMALAGVGAVLGGGIPLLAMGALGAAGMAGRSFFGGRGELTEREQRQQERMLGFGQQASFYQTRIEDLNKQIMTLQGRGELSAPEQMTLQRYQREQQRAEQLQGLYTQAGAYSTTLADFGYGNINERIERVMAKGQIEGTGPASLFLVGANALTESAENIRKAREEGDVGGIKEAERGYGEAVAMTSNNLMKALETVDRSDKSQMEILRQGGVSFIQNMERAGSEVSPTASYQRGGTIASLVQQNLESQLRGGFELDQGMANVWSSIEMASGRKLKEFGVTSPLDLLAGGELTSRSKFIEKYAGRYEGETERERRSRAASDFNEIVIGSAKALESTLTSEEFKKGITERRERLERIKGIDLGGYSYAERTDIQRQIGREEKGLAKLEEFTKLNEAVKESYGGRGLGELSVNELNELYATGFGQKLKTSFENVGDAATKLNNRFSVSSESVAKSSGIMVQKMAENAQLLSQGLITNEEFLNTTQGFASQAKNNLKNLVETGNLQKKEGAVKITTAIADIAKSGLSESIFAQELMGMTPEELMKVDEFTGKTRIEALKQAAAGADIDWEKLDSGVRQFQEGEKSLLDAKKIEAQQSEEMANIGMLMSPMARKEFGFAAEWAGMDPQNMQKIQNAAMDQIGQAFDLYQAAGTEQEKSAATTFLQRSLAGGKGVGLNPYMIRQMVGADMFDQTFSEITDKATRGIVDTSELASRMGFGGEVQEDRPTARMETRDRDEQMASAAHSMAMLSNENIQWSSHEREFKNLD